MTQRPSEPGYVPPVAYDDVTHYEPYPDAVGPAQVDYEIETAHQEVAATGQGTGPNLPQAVAAMVRDLTAFHGRTDRNAFWLGTLGILGSLAVVSVVVAAVLIVVAVAIGSSGAALVAGVGGAVLLIGALAAFLALLSGGVRRLHDSGLPGWLLALWFVPFGWIAVVVLLSRPTQRRRNLYGPEPGLR